MSDAGNDLGLVLVLGGVRSGKSAFAEGLVSAAGSPAYIATAEPVDVCLTERITKHQARRGTEWRTFEVPLDVSGAVKRAGGDGCAVLVDSLGMWLNNVLHRQLDLDAAKAELIQSLAAARTVVVVSDESGLGGVADNALARRFADHLGELNQQIAALADSVYLVVAGIPTQIKEAGRSRPASETKL